MQKDIRATELYREIEALYATIRQPGTGQISDAAEIHVSPSGKHVVLSGSILHKLEGVPPTRICQVDLASGDTRVLTFGPNTDRLPKYSPDGKQIAFLSDRGGAGDFQLYLLDPVTGAARSAPRVNGWVEYLHWAPDGRRILLGVAGHGADIAGVQGAISSRQVAESLPSWMPRVETGDESYRWRTAWVYELDAQSVRQISAERWNVWEAVWCGSQGIAAVVSHGPSEGLWYQASLRILEITAEARDREMFRPRDQIGWPAGSPSGKHLAVVEALCSDRGIVSGELRLIDTSTGNIQKIDTSGVDITYTEWRSDRHLLLAGYRDFESVIGLYDAELNDFSDVWSSTQISAGWPYMTVSGLNEPGDCVLVGEGYARAPEVAVISRGTYRCVKSFDVGYTKEAGAIGAAEPVSWPADDGLDVHGWILRPRDKSPHPTIMNVHGGPVWHWRPMWLGRGGGFTLMLLKKGYAVFFPNPRGSTGRGQDFIRRVLGDMGGADTHDLLSGLDHLVKVGIADPRRLGVTGASYGGFMSSWLITQDPRFSAAVPVAPITNQVTERLISNIPHFVDLFLADSYNNPAGKYFERSPIMHAQKVKTPTLNICGLLDRSAPPEEAVQFHNALLENGVSSVLLTYPEEGHGVRKLPALIDYAARIVSWFEKHMRS